MTQLTQSTPIRVVITGNDKSLCGQGQHIDMSSGDIFILFGAHLAINSSQTTTLLENMATLPFTYKILAESPLDYTIAGGVRNAIVNISNTMHVSTQTTLTTPLLTPNDTLTDEQTELLSKIFVLNGNSTWMHGVQIYNASFGTLYRPMIKKYDIVIVPMLTDEVYNDIAIYSPHFVLVHDQHNTPFGESRIFQVMQSTVITMNSANPLVLTLYS